MDTTVESIGAVVVAQLRAADYMESTIGQYEKTKRQQFVAERRGIYTPALGADFASMTVSPRKGRFSALRRFDHGRLVGLFDGYVAAGLVDLSSLKRGGGRRRPESSEFIALNVAWQVDMVDRGLAPATVNAYGRVAREYLVFLESRGVCCLDAAGGASVLAFLESLLDGWAKSSLFWVVSNSARSLSSLTGRIWSRPQAWQVSGALTQSCPFSAIPTRSDSCRGARQKRSTITDYIARRRLQYAMNRPAVR